MQPQLRQYVHRAEQAQSYGAALRFLPTHCESCGKLLDSAGECWGCDYDIAMPAEEDYTIADAGNRGYSVSVYGCGHIGTFASLHEAEQAVRNNAGPDWRPDVWLVNERGDATLHSNFDWQDA